jgi:uncharacterized membrane protein YdjX (TVP38/TMEM64 family)
MGGLAPVPPPSWRQPSGSAPPLPGGRPRPGRLGQLSRWGGGLALAGLLGGLAVVTASDRMHGWVLGVLEALAPLFVARPVLGGGVFVGLAAVSAMLAFFSSTLLVPVAVQAWGVEASVALLWVGWWLGGLTAYGIGRYLGRPVVARLASAEALARYGTAVHGRVSFARAVLIQVALPSEVPGYLFGLARYPLGRYLAALGLAEVPFAVGAVAVSASLIERRTVALVAVGLGVALVSVLALAGLRGRWAREDATLRGAATPRGRER